MKLSDKVQKRVHLIYGIALSVILAVIGVLFIISCYSIYKSGPSPFTRESIGVAFSRIAVPVYLAIFFIVIGGVIDVVMPKEQKKLAPMRSPKAQAAKLASRVDVTALDADLATKINKERGLRKTLGYVRLALIVLSATLPLIYLLNPANFPAENNQYNSEILHGMLFYLICLLPLTVFEVVWAFASDASYVREHEALKEAVKAVGIGSSPIKAPKTKITAVKEFLLANEKPIVLGVRIAFVGCAIGFIIAGVLNGGMADVLGKAIKICKECIGIG